MASATCTLRPLSYIILLVSYILTPASVANRSAPTCEQDSDNLSTEQNIHFFMKQNGKLYFVQFICGSALETDLKQYTSNTTTI